MCPCYKQNVSRVKTCFMEKHKYCTLYDGVCERETGRVTNVQKVLHNIFELACWQLSVRACYVYVKKKGLKKRKPRYQYVK